MLLAWSGVGDTRTFLAAGPPYQLPQLTQGGRTFTVARAGSYTFSWSLGQACAGDYWGFMFLDAQNPGRTVTVTSDAYGAHSSRDGLSGTRRVTLDAGGVWGVQTIADYSQFGNDSDPFCSWSIVLASSPVAAPSPPVLTRPTPTPTLRPTPTATPVVRTVTTDRTVANTDVTFYVIFRGFPLGTQIQYVSVTDSAGQVGQFASSSQPFTVYTNSDPYYYDMHLGRAARPMYVGPATITFLVGGTNYSVQVCAIRC